MWKWSRRWRCRGKKAFFKNWRALLREDLDETKSYSTAVRKSANEKRHTFAEPHKLPRIKKVDKLAEERLVEKGKAPEEKAAFFCWSIRRAGAA